MSILTPHPAEAEPAAPARSRRSPTTACWPTATRPRWWIAPARSTGCACRATTATRSSRACSTPTPATGRSGRPARSRAERRYLPGTLVIETTFTTDTGTVRLTRRDGVRRGPARPRPRLRRAARAAARRRGRLRRGRARDGARAAPGVRPDHAADPARGRRRAHVRLRPHRGALGRAARGRGRDDARRVHRARRRAARVLAALGVAGGSRGARADARRAASPSGSRTPPRRGAPGRPSTTSTRARTTTSCSTARAC